MNSVLHFPTICCQLAVVGTFFDKVMQLSQWPTIIYMTLLEWKWPCFQIGLKTLIEKAIIYIYIYIRQLYIYIYIPWDKRQCKKQTQKKIVIFLQFGTAILSHAWMHHIHHFLNYFCNVPIKIYRLRKNCCR